MPAPQDQLLEFILGRYLVYAAIGLVLIYALRRVAIYFKRKAKANRRVFMIDPDAFFNLSLGEKKLTELEDRSP